LPYNQMRVTPGLRSCAGYREILITVGLFGGAVFLFSLEWFYDIGREGISTVGAERVLRGEMPYRDFWTMYAPGQFYLVALLFKIFGTHLLVEVVAASILCAAAACVYYWLVLNLVGRKLAALVPVGIFLAAMYNTGYFKRLGSYPPAILFIFMAINSMILYVKQGKLGYLFAAGVATGTAVIFKHDVGGYTAVAIIAGLIGYHFLAPVLRADQVHSLLLKVATYVIGLVAIPIPVFTYFAVLAWPDMLQDLIVFPSTDFRFARPEGYPNLFPFGIYNQSPLKMLDNLFTYLNLTVPFVMFLLGLVAIGLALGRRKLDYAAAAVTFSVGYLLHYAAAHVQINTHMVTMSVYAACLGLLLYDLAVDEIFTNRSVYKWVAATAGLGWILSLSAKPLYVNWQHRRLSTAELQLSKVAGFNASSTDSRAFAELSAFVHAHTEPRQRLFVGLHRHDVVIIGDVMIYFVLDRPSATRYHELHPAVTDTARVQNEIIRDLQEKNVSLVILKYIFSDEALEREKMNFARHLSKSGATDLDEFIGKNYLHVRTFGPYAVWQRKDAIIAVAEPHRAF
jgi:hypothetical protein